VSDPLNEFTVMQNASRRGGAPCSLAATVASLPEDKRHRLLLALADQSITTKTICRVLATWGLDFHSGVIRRHRPWQAPGDRCLTCLG
jgi:CTP:molybdopterin cytidylyltransferase MocA